jgi:hypothetical protein
MALRTGIEHLDYTPKFESGLSYTIQTPVLQTEDRVRPVFDAENRIFMIAVEGAPTPQNIERALALLDLPSRTWRDVLAIAFAGKAIPSAAVRDALAKKSVSIVVGQPSSRALDKAIQHRADLLSLRGPQEPQAVHRAA